MWRLALVLVVVAGSCHACPESCECHHLPDPEDLAVLVEATCLGRSPRLADLPLTTRCLRILDAEETEIPYILEELANGTAALPYLDEFVLTNCSLGTLNASTWFAGLERIRTLNVSRNQLLDLNDVRMVNRVNLTNLVAFDVSYNLVSNLSADTFRTLPVLVRLCLKGNNISHVDAKAFDGLSVLEDLDLSDNKLVSLPANALTPLESLQKLDLSGNQLQVLGAGWFESLGRLRELDVSRNGLARAASGALQPLPGLSVLRLAENPLRERDVSLLLGTGRKLETVDASRTGLIRVPAALTRSVRALRLAGNKLTSIRGGDLDSYPLLRLLDMSDNRLTDVEDDALGRLEVLDDLDVSGNFLTEVPRSLPGSLSSLNLERNLIKALRFNDLQGLYNLRVLLLRKNSIVEIQEGALSQLLALELLDISDNPVKQLPANTLNGPARLNTLRMSGLAALQWDQREQGDLTFPVPAPERLVDLDVSRSPVLAAQLLADTAALSACRSLTRLNLMTTNVTTLRSDLVYFVPQLRVLGLGGNPWNCDEDLYWLGEWSRDHEELEPLAKCSTGIHVRELPSPPTTPPSTNVATSSENSASRSTEITAVQSSNATSFYPEDDSPRENTKEDYFTAETLLSNLTAENATLKLLSPREEVETESYSTLSSSTTLKVNRVKGDEIVQKNSGPKLNVQSSRINNWQKLNVGRNRHGNIMDSLTKEIHSSNNEEKTEEKKKQKERSDRDGAQTVAEELSGLATGSGARVSEALSAGAHPGMLILVGAALGAVAALSVVLSRRATARRRDCCYQRQENIEVHTLTPVTELW